MLDIILNFNLYINYCVSVLGIWFYVALFLIIFCETGIVFGILLPGDSLLVALGLAAAATAINVHLVVFTICIAAICGDSFNYITGRIVGTKIFSHKARFLKTQYLITTKYYLEKHGVKAIIFSRFIAFVRTLTPFVAGVSRMSYPKFFIYGVISAIIWPCTIVYSVFAFSNNKFVQDNLSLIIFGIILLVILQMIAKSFINKRRIKKTKH